VNDEAFHFPADLTIYQVQETMLKVRDTWEAGVRNFDVSGIQTLDAAGAQLLASIQKTATQQKTPVRWVNWSPEALEILAVLGLSRLFNNEQHGREQ
jgi:anti-anti-sigma regulatory factor